MPEVEPHRKAKTSEEWLVTLPSLVWLGLFFLVPTVVILILGFKPADLTGGVAHGWTLANFRSLVSVEYAELFWRTVWITGLTSFLCVVIALPAGYAMARASKRWRNMLLLLVAVPFWTNFLIRIFAWKTLLQVDGPVSAFLEWSSLFEEAPTLLYNNWAVLVVMVYTQLPFAILPIYAAAEKFDFSLLEAARDLGASKRTAFLQVFVPGISRGISAAAMMVFVAALGMYVIPDLVGGVDGEMIGNKIVQRVQSDRNLPVASALAAALLLLVSGLTFGGLKAAFRREQS